jgi:hypothetical protein
MENLNSLSVFALEHNDDGFQYVWSLHENMDSLLIVLCFDYHSK